MIIVNLQFSNINSGFCKKKNDFKKLFTLVIFFRFYLLEPVIVGQTTSKQLEQLLTSFNVNIPEDHLNESLVTKQVIEKWIFDIKSLSKEVCFMREVPKAENLCTLDVCAVEVDVVCAQDDQDELTVNNKVWLLTLCIFYNPD